MKCFTETVEVHTDPQTAFRIFTEEYDQWWGNSPISSYSSWRLIERRIEPGVGGRILEDYGDEIRVLGVISTWEPGTRLAWSTDAGVSIDVSFEPHGNITHVVLTGAVPEGVDGNADLAVLRVAPRALPSYLLHRNGEPEPRPLGRLHLGIRCSTPAATARWLANAFQLQPTSELPDLETDPHLTWIELRIGNSLIVLWGGGSEEGSAMTPILYVDDLDAHFAHARASGAAIESPIVENGYRAYTAKDCDGRSWQFAQSGPRIGH